MDAVGAYIMRRFAYYGAEKYGIYGRLARFERILINSYRRGLCVPVDVLGHYVDDVFIKLINNMDKRLRVVSGRELLIDSDDVDDPVVQQNYILLPTLFYYVEYICPVTGGSCASNPSYTCANVYALNGAPVCCSGYYVSFDTIDGYFVDNLPFISNYSSGEMGPSYEYPTTPGVVVLGFSFKAPSCYPSSGVTLSGPVIATWESGSYGGTCASSCPSNSICSSGSYNVCPGSTQSGVFAPILYFNSQITAIPNGVYSAWVQFQYS